MTYYEVVGIISGKIEVLYGSYQKSDCVYEKEAEKEWWRDQGYRKIRITSREVKEIPDKEVYEGEIVTGKELFHQQAPSFNFELSESELIEHALETGFVSVVGNDRYLINKDY